MRDKPSGQELLDLARRAKAGDGTIAVPGDQRYKDLMIARAEAIAVRQIETGDAPERAEKESLSEILGHDGSLPDLNAQLAAAIREGRYDPGTPGHDAALKHVRDTARERLKESNSKALAPE
ncbi:MAG: hypothetical protein HQ512_10655 [Rhodospirillales bacterium]|nr:hypothetical protein [Rhodospirillales bacterium]